LKVLEVVRRKEDEGKSVKFADETIERCTNRETKKFCRVRTVEEEAAKEGGRRNAGVKKEHVKEEQV
jgi:hypothetical protein